MKYEKRNWHFASSYHVFFLCVCVSWKSKDNERDHNIYVHTYNLFPLPEFKSLQNLKKERKNWSSSYLNVKKNQFINFLGISWTQDNIFTSICI